MEIYALIRDEDVSGVSGTGKVADVIYWPDSKVAVVHWLVAGRTTTVYHPGAEPAWGDELFTGLYKVERIHGHDGKTRLEMVKKI